MALFDLPLDELQDYRPARAAPADLVEFWQRTLDSTAVYPLDAQFEPYDAAMPGVDTFDVRFRGFGGDPIAAWLLVPRNGRERAPCVVQYLGYGSGRGHAHDHTLWPAAGWAVLLVDTRGVSGLHGSPGVTGDPHATTWPQTPGYVTRGIHDPNEYYYRRVFTDAVRAVDVAATAPQIDPSTLVVAGGSQGGAIAQAAAVLRTLTPGPQPVAAMIDVPFLTHIRRAIEITDSEPYQEIVRYLATQRTDVEQVLATLDYFDGLNLAPLAQIPALYSAALRDPICPPSTVFAAYNAWGGPKSIRVWPFNQHEGGGSAQRGEQLRYLRSLLLARADVAAQ